jgi:hypothetical protein
MGKTNRYLIAVLTAACAGAPAWAQLRVLQWNVTNLGNSTTTTRIPDFRTSIYGIVPSGPLAGKTMAPDLIVAQEFESTAAVTTFLAMLNDTSTPPAGLIASPGDWAAATWVPNTNFSGDTAGAFFYRTSKIQTLSGTGSVAPVIVSLGVQNTNGIPPRDTQRYDVRLAGYGNVEGAVVSFYCSHSKAGSTSADQAKRQTEFNRISTNALALPAGRLFMFCADTNTQSAAQTAYLQLINLGGPTGGTVGPFHDPIDSVLDGTSYASWENNAAYRIIHTQDPGVGQQMDSRHDQILISANIFDGAAFDYIGNVTIPYSTATWNDPNHSYRCWGNDGSGNGTTSSLNITSNSEVGNPIAAALQRTADGLGHLPVYADFKVPAKAAVNVSSIDFGTVNQNSTASQTLTVTNTGDVAKWNIAGIANLKYHMTITGGFTVTSAGTVASPDIEPPGGGFNSHTVAMPTGATGSHSGVLTIFTDAPESPTITINLSGNVIVPPPVCPADIGIQGGQPGHDGMLDNNDFVVFINLFFAQDARADFGIQGGQPGQDGVFDNNDFVVFINEFFAGCN